MTRRLHTSELGCIAGEDLSDLGAGKEGWLVENQSLVVALDTHALAFANRDSVLILNWSVSIDGRPIPDTRHAVKIVPELSPVGNEYVSAIEWFVVDDEIRVLVVGTSFGYVMMFSVQGSLLHRQFVNPGMILKLRVQQDTTQGALSQGVSIVMPGAIARFEGSEIKNLLQLRKSTNSLFWDNKFHEKDSGNAFSVLPCQLWNVNKYGFCVDAAITGVMPPPLMEIQLSQRYYCAVTIGDDAVISAYRLSVDNSRSLVGAILSKVVPATFSTISSFSKFIWPSPSEPNRKKKPEPTSQSARAFPLTCLKDHPRKGEKLTLSPSGTLAAITDSLGRILLLDTQAFVVVRLWKGYREASCLFVEMLPTKEKPSPNPRTKSDFCLCLAIHAPRKGILEVWQMRTGPRLLTIQCPKGCRILQPTYRYNSASQSSPSSSYIPLQVFILNGDSGEVSVLNPSFH